MEWSTFWTWYLQILAAFALLWLIARAVAVTVLQARREFWVQTIAIEDSLEDEVVEEKIFSSRDGK